MRKFIFFFILAAGFLGSILQEDRSFSAYENRSLQQLPSFSFSKLLNGSYTKGYESYLNDQFLQRDFWVSLKTASDRSLLHNFCINGVYLGSGGYLIDRYTRSDINPSQISENIKYLNEFSEIYAADVILVPTASEILTNRLPVFSSHLDQEELLTGITARKEIGQVLAAHRSEDIYFKTDHHWSLYGAYCAYASLVSDPLPYHAKSVSNSFYGSTYRKLNGKAEPDTLEQFQTDNQFTVVYDTQEVHDSLYEESHLATEDKYSYYLDGNHAVTQIMNQNNDQNRSVLVIKDSFANIFATLLCNHYKNTHLIDLRYYNGSIRSYIEEHEIDEVIFLYNNINFMQDKNLAKLLL